MLCSGWCRVIRQTSLDSYNALRDTAALSKRQAEVMRCVHMRFHGRTFTRKQLAVALDWPINRVTGRVLELIEAGYLEEQGTTVEDGRSAHLLTIKAAQMEMEWAA
jgi:hypothetical protein